MQRKGNTISKWIRRLIAAAVCLSCTFCVIPVGNIEAYGARTLTLKACRSLAIQTSLDYENAEDRIESKNAEYDSAVKALKLKEKSMRQFRWSPLLNFKFPTSPNFEQASEFQYKPVALQYEIRVAEHQLIDKTFEISEKVNNLYVEIVVLQETIAFNEKRLEAVNDALKRNRAKLALGQANKADIDKLESQVKSLNNKVASDRRSLEADLKKLSNMVGMDVSTGYKFEKPFVEATIDRNMLDALIQYTEDRDEGYYEACVNEVSAKAELTTNSGLARNKYGRDYNMIATYVTSSLSGSDVNKKAFKKDYKAFLEKIDSYWKGKKRICLFIKVPRLWFKGDMDGTRYMEDDPYILYQNVLDYNSAYNEKLACKEELDQSVTDSFNNYISVRNACNQTDEELKKAGESLERSALLNRTGELSFEEYDSEMASYEELQNSMFDSMKLYTNTLYSLDRLTCGGITALLSGTDADLETAGRGESYPVKKTADGIFYTLKSIIQSQEFELRLTVPDDFPVNITDYELWVDNTLVGGRMPVDKALRHLALAKEDVTEAKIRLYDGDKFVDDCEIDPSEESGKLIVTIGYDIETNLEEEIGTFDIETNDTTGLVEFKVVPENKDVKFFKVITSEGKSLGGDKKIAIDKPLKYISVLKDSVSELRVEFYDESEGLIETGRCDEANGVIRREAAE